MFKKKIRQRVHKCSVGKAPFPSDKEYACHVLGRMVKKKLKSPSTSETMSKILDRQHTRCQKVPNPVIIDIYRKIVKYRNNRNILRLNETVKELKRNATIREAARQLNIQYTSLYRLITYRQGNNKRKLSERDKAKVIELYSSNRISLQLPFKKYAKYYYLRSTLAVAYDEYVRSQKTLGDTVLSKTSVYRCLKGKFRTRRKIPFKDCQCVKCVNGSLLVDSVIA